MEIRYTLDGSVPDINSPIYTDTLTLAETTTLIARCFRSNTPVSESSSATFTKVQPLPSFIPDEVEQGLAAYYYEGDWDSLPDFNTITPLKSIVVDDFTLEPRINNDHYGFSFEGMIEIKEDGVYDFYTESDDGSKLYIDDTLVVDNDGLHGMKEEKSTVPLSKGFHKIEVKYFEKDGGDNLNIYFKAPGEQKKKVPASILYKREK